MREKGQVGAPVGFSNPSDGWHVAVVQEGLNLSVNAGSQKESFMVPFAIDDDGEDNGKRVTLFINTRDENRLPYKSVEKQFANLLANLKLEDAFNKKFPGDVSYLDQPVVDAMKIKLPGNFLKLKTRITKDKNNVERCNIVQLNTIDAKVEDAPKTETKAGAGSVKETEAPW